MRIGIKELSLTMMIAVGLIATFSCKVRSTDSSRIHTASGNTGSCDDEQLESEIRAFLNGETNSIGNICVDRAKEQTKAFIESKQNSSNSIDDCEKQNLDRLITLFLGVKPTPSIGEYEPRRPDDLELEREIQKFLGTTPTPSLSSYTPKPPKKCQQGDPDLEKAIEDFLGVKPTPSINESVEALNANQKKIYNLECRHRNDEYNEEYGEFEHRVDILAYENGRVKPTVFWTNYNTAPKPPTKAKFWAAFEAEECDLSHSENDLNINCTKKNSESALRKMVLKKIHPSDTAMEPFLDYSVTFEFKNFTKKIDYLINECKLTLKTQP